MRLSVSGAGKNSAGELRRGAAFPALPVVKLVPTHSAPAMQCIALTVSGPMESGIWSGEAGVEPVMEQQ